MRPAMFVILCIASLTACKSDSGDTMQPVTVQWMEWPAEVAAGQPFRTRLIVWGVCAVDPRFHAGPSADESAVTFEPYFLLSGEPVYCLGVRAPVERLIAYSIDTAGMAPALSPDFPRAYEMRASASMYVGTARAEGLPVRTFGSVTVRPEPSSTNHNAAGYVSVVVDTLGCVRVHPAWAYGPGRGIVIDNADDTVGMTGAFVRGYIYDLTVPKCGETRAFHLLSKN